MEATTDELKVDLTIEFKREGTFQSFYAAQSWLGEHGYSYGSMCSPQPIGVLKGDWNIAKWKNLTAKEKRELDGIMISDNWREGSVKIKIFKK